MAQGCLLVSLSVSESVGDSNGRCCDAERLQQHRPVTNGRGRSGQARAQLAAGVAWTASSNPENYCGVECGLRLGAL